MVSSHPHPMRAARLPDQTWYHRPAALSSISTPQMTGLELVAQLRMDGVGIPVLLFSAQLSPAILARAAQLGIEKVLVKPPPEDELLGFVDAHK